MPFLKKDWRGIVSVILKEGSTGHSRCHTQIRIGDIVGVIIKEGLVGHSQYHTERRIGRALGGAAIVSIILKEGLADPTTILHYYNPSLSMRPTVSRQSFF